MVLAIILIVLALIAAGAGFWNLTDATLGVGLIGLACFHAILARLAQADHHHKKLMDQIKYQTMEIAKPIERARSDAPAHSTTTPSASRRQPGKIRCPHCHVFIPADASECPYCNKFVK